MLAGVRVRGPKLITPVYFAAKEAARRPNAARYDARIYVVGPVEWLTKGKQILKPSSCMMHDDVQTCFE